MAVRSYTQLYQRLQELIARGTKVADVMAGTPADEIHKWINQAELCLLVLEDKIPTVVSDFRRIRQNLEFAAVDDGCIETEPSNSAYVPEGTDVLLDFRFEQLDQANGILKFAATKIEIEGLALASAHSDNKPIGERLHAARDRACETQEQAAEQIGCDHKDISEWERGKREPHPKSTKKIQNYIKKHSTT